MSDHPGTVWTIAGSDSSGLAGAQADLRTLQSFGLHGASVITAVTAQGVETYGGHLLIPEPQVRAQLEALRRELPPRSVKIGMLGSAPTILAVAETLEKVAAPVVLDPVLQASAGPSLLTPEGLDALVRHLLPRADLVMPNRPEAEILTGLSLQGDEDVPRAAQSLLARGARRVLIKGGHGRSPWSHDFYADRERSFWLTSPRRTADCRGTGCTYASAVAAALARGEEPGDAVVVGRAYVSRAIHRATPLGTGGGGGGRSLLWHGPWPVTAEDFPWATRDLALARERPQFPATGPEPLGFYPIVDRAAWICRLAGHGVRTAQLRIKDLQGEALAREVAEAVRVASASGLRLFINDHWRLALDLGAYGVHLGQEDLETADLEALARSGVRLGVSTHSYLEAALAHALRPSYVALGPIFETTCKSMRFGPQGLARIAEWRSLMDVPLVAIGGLRCEDAARVRALGADGMAVISDVRDAAVPDERIRAWLKACGGPTS